MVPCLLLPPFSSGPAKFPVPSPAQAAGSSCRKDVIAALLAYAKELQELLRNKVQVRPGLCKANGSVGAAIASNSCKGADGARETVIRKNSGREWEKESKPPQKAGYKLGRAAP